MFEYPNSVSFPFRENSRSGSRLLQKFPKFKGKGKIIKMKLYVGNISFQTTNQDLNDLFGTVGTVQSANVIEDRDTGRSRGFGFVEMASKEDGEAAIEQLNGKEVDGRAIKVNEAKAREDRGNGGGRGRGNYGGGGNRRGGYDRGW